MSWNCEIVDPVTRESIELDTPLQFKGGTYQVGGSTKLWLNITYNYGRKLRAAGMENSIGDLRDKVAGETIPILEAVASKLGNDTNDDYWKDADGNVKQAILQLLAMAKMRPDGIWEIN